MLLKMGSQINARNNYERKVNSASIPGIQLYDANFALFHQLKLLTIIFQ